MSPPFFILNGTMTDPTNAIPEPQDEAAVANTGAETPAADDASAQQTHEEQVIAALLASQTEIASLKDKVLRTLADMENLRRRTEREVADAKAYGVTGFARDMLTFADNLRRAVESIPADALASVDVPIKSFIEGVEVTERDFLSRLARHGVKKLEPQGQKFDPNFHEALFEIPDESVPTGTVAQVVESGYSIGERVLRPAKVGVTRGGPKS